MGVWVLIIPILAREAIKMAIIASPEKNKDVDAMIAKDCVAIERDGDNAATAIARECEVRAMRITAPKNREVIVLSLLLSKLRHMYIIAPRRTAVVMCTGPLAARSDNHDAANLYRGCIGYIVYALYLYIYNIYTIYILYIYNIYTIYILYIVQSHNP